MTIGSAVGRTRTWLWALGSVLAVILLVGSAYVAHHVVVGGRGAAPINAPPAPSLDVASVTAPGPSYELLANDQLAGHVVALASSGQPICPPVGLCPAPAPLSSLVVFDEATGAILERTPLGGSAATQSALLLVNDQLHVAYAVAAGSVSLYSTVTGAPQGSYALPSSLSWKIETGGAYDPTNQALILAGGGRLAVLDAATGLVRQETGIGYALAGSPVDGPVLDVQTNALYLLAHTTASGEPTLLAYDATTLAPLWRLPMPGTTGLGPLTADGLYLTLYQRSGMVSIQPAVRALGAASDSRDFPAARGAVALGWYTTPGSPADLYVATGNGIDLRSAGTGAVLSTLPMHVDWPGALPMVVDSETGTIYLPGAHGQLVIARGAAGSSGRPVNAATAVVLAHSALASFLPFTNQDPPFISPDTFLLGATADGQSIPMTYWIHYIDFQWTLGPYPGTTSATVIPTEAAVGHGGYLVTFTIRWNEDFWRTHSWTCLVASNGSVSLRSDSGDLVP